MTGHLQMSPSKGALFAIRLCDEAAEKHQPRSHRSEPVHADTLRDALKRRAGRHRRNTQTGFYKLTGGGVSVRLHNLGGLLLPGVAMSKVSNGHFTSCVVTKLRHTGLDC